MPRILICGECDGKKKNATEKKHQQKSDELLSTIIKMEDFWYLKS